MTPVHFSLAAVIAAAKGLVRGQEAYMCDLPAAGCRYGMFNQAKCACECIPPFCPDADPVVACSTATTCDNPWEKCVRGTDCPWWKNDANKDACTTGPEVPPGLWEIYNTEEFCCKANFPYSEICYVPKESESPTKHPSLLAPEVGHEIVPIRFDVFGLPLNAVIEDLRKELKLVTTRVILRLAESIKDLKISKVEERGGGVTDNLDGGKSMYFNIYAVRDEDKKFTPLIVQAIRDSHVEVVQQIQTFTDINYFTEYVSVNICAMQNGAYDACAKEEPTSTPSSTLVIPPPSINTPTATLVSETDTEIGEGLSGGAISIIVIFVLLFVCCVGYAIAVACFGVANCFDDCFGDRDDAKQAHDNLFWDEMSRNDRSRDDRSRVSRQGSRMLAIENGNFRSTPEDNDSAFIDAPRHSHSVNSYSANHDSQSVNSYSTKHNSHSVNSYGRNRKISRDPTMYIPGQEDKPDPNSENQSSLSKSSRDTAIYFNEEFPRKDPQLKPTRDPTMYIDGHRETDMYTIDDRNYSGVDRATRDVDSSEFGFYDDDNSQRIDENRSVKSLRSKKTTNTIKSNKGVSEKIQKSLDSPDWNASSSDFIYEPKKRASLRASLVSIYNDSASINDVHADSFPDGGARYGVKDTRQTKSFYK